MISTTGSVITPRDFNKNTQDPQRDEWSPGAMHHLVQALNGAPVAIVCDKHTGFTSIGVTLGGVRERRGHFEVLVKRAHSDGTTGRCWHLLFKVGMVMTFDQDGDGLGARYTAVQSYNEEQTRAVRKLQDTMMADLGIARRDDLPRGTWSARSFPGYVHASYQPEKILGPNRFTYQAYSSASLADAQ